MSVFVFVYVYIAAYVLAGLCVTHFRVWFLRRMGVRLSMNGYTWFFCVAIWPLDVVLSVWRFVRLKRLLRKAK